MFHYACTRDYSKDDGENWENDEEAYEEFWRWFLVEDEKENTSADAEGSSEETPENLPPRPKLSLRFQEVNCTT